MTILNIVKRSHGSVSTFAYIGGHGSRSPKEPNGDETIASKRFTLFLCMLYQWTLFSWSAVVHARILKGRQTEEAETPTKKWVGKP